MRRVSTAILLVVVSALLVIRLAKQLVFFRKLEGDVWALFVAVDTTTPSMKLVLSSYRYNESLTTVTLLMAPIVLAALIWNFAPAHAKLLRWFGAMGIFVAALFVLTPFFSDMASYKTVSPVAWLQLPFVSFGSSQGSGSISINLRTAFDRGFVFRDFTYDFKPVWASSTISPNQVTLSSPLWMMSWAIAVPSLALYFASRRPLPGHCRCGYNLTGNTSGICPECGTPCHNKSSTEKSESTSTIENPERTI